MTEPKGYNPLELDNLADSVATALLREVPVPLESLMRFEGAGIYALYYTGGFPAYERVAAQNAGGKWLAPIYTGKAVPAGGRKGNVRVGGAPLFSRLMDHRASIDAATNLQLADFHCRRLVVESIWIPLGESLLINRYQPVWNAMVDGFGNHDPGAGRYKGAQPRWDLLHPGRTWATRLAARNETATQIEAEMAQYLAERLPDPRIENLPAPEPNDGVRGGT